MAGHAGFDRSDYPGDAVMAWLKANTNLVWCGYYFGVAPSHSGTSWMGKRAHLVGAGWGIAPIYVGEQVIPPGSENPSAAKGAIDKAELNAQKHVSKTLDVSGKDVDEAVKETAKTMS